MAAQELGVDVVVDRTRDDVVAAVRAATEGRGVDVVFDPVGGASYDASTKVVAFEGRIVVVGFASGAIPQPPLSHALVKNYSILGLHWGLYRSKDPALVRRCHEELMGLRLRGCRAATRRRPPALRRRPGRAGPARRRRGRRPAHGRAAAG